MPPASPGLGRQLRKFLAFEGVSLPIVLLTALLSYGLQLGAILGGQPLYVIVFLTLLPWLPLLVFEGIWKVRNYAMIAVLGLITILQLAQFLAHLVQILQIHLWNGTLACPPPVDTAINAARAVEFGLREVSEQPTFATVDKIVMPGVDGFPLTRADGSEVLGPAACAIFGQLHLELVHLAWGLLAFAGMALAVLHFPRNRFLYLAFLVLAWSTAEQLTIAWFHYVDTGQDWRGSEQLWATMQGVGNTFEAVPMGLAEVAQDFYAAGGRNGLFASGGMLAALTGIDGLPDRAELRMIYSLAATAPMVLGFLVELRGLHNRYLEQVFGDLSPDQIAALSLEVSDVSFRKGEVILREGEVATECFLIKDGEVGIVIGLDTPDARVAATIGSGQLLGEMALIDGTPRSATAIARTPCTCLRMDARTFAQIMTPGSDLGSEATLRQVQRIAEQRRWMNATHKER